MNGLLHRRHPDQRAEDRGLEQGSLDRDAQMTVQGSDGLIVAFKRSNRRTLDAGAARDLKGYQGDD